MESKNEIKKKYLNERKYPQKNTRKKKRNTT